MSLLKNILAKLPHNKEKEQAETLEKLEMSEYVNGVITYADTLKEALSKRTYPMRDFFNFTIKSADTICVFPISLQELVVNAKGQFFILPIDSELYNYLSEIIADGCYFIQYQHIRIDTETKEIFTKENAIKEGILELVITLYPAPHLIHNEDFEEKYKDRINYLLNYSSVSFSKDYYKDAPTLTTIMEYQNL